MRCSGKIERSSLPEKSLNFSIPFGKEGPCLRAAIRFYAMSGDMILTEKQEPRRSCAYLKRQLGEAGKIWANCAGRRILHLRIR